MATVRTLGIDLSSDPSATAACLLAWPTGRVEIVELAPENAGATLDIDDQERLIGNANKTGIDAPFGWPVPFLDAITKWSAGEPWTAIDRRPLRYRTTDEQARGEPKMPLSVSTERLGATAMACALLLSRLQRVDRSGRTGPVAEVYPAAALHYWELPSQGYKAAGPDALMLRRQIVEGLEEGLGEKWKPTPEHRDRLIAEHDLLDALVAALVARAAQLKKASLPSTKEERRLAEVEGWIRLPRCPLRHLVSV